MTDESTPELSPEARQQMDQARVRSQLGATDTYRTAMSVLHDVFGVGGGLGPFARTSFEGHELNAMIDLVRTADPADLESAGNALWKARDALREAAGELQDYIEKVEWKGESGNEFRSFGKGLAEHARNLGSFADAAATQITVAGTGLASVHKSMPPRDSRTVKHRVEDLPVTKRVEGDPDYQAAVRVEKNRQEAINQMNRLASFYAVSEEALAAQQPPEFNRLLQADVPPPKADVGPDSIPGGPAAHGGAADARMVPHQVTGQALGAGTVSVSPGGAAGPPPSLDSTGSTGSAVPGGAPDTSGTGGVPPADGLGAGGPLPGPDTSTEIDSVAVPAAPVTGPAGSAPPSATGTAGSAGGSAPPPSGGYVSPVQGGVPRATGTTGASGVVGGRGAAASGHSGAAGGRPTATGRPGAGYASASGTAGAGGPVTGRASASGTAGSAGSTGSAGRSPAGRTAAGQAPVGRSGGAGEAAGGRANGIVGGNPQRSAPGSAGSPVSRLPRGTVIGGEGAAQGRAAGRPAGRGTPGANGVVGTPRGGASASRPGTGGFTRGGSGLVRGPGGRDAPEDEEERAGSTRPDYLTEDEETWQAGRRGSVPPVIQ